MKVACDTHLRSIAKGFSWRFTATTTTVLIAGLVTGDAAIAVTIGGIEALAKVAIYYGHERLWLRIGWGRQVTEIEPPPVPAVPGTV